MFGYVSVLPGAFSTFRWEAIKGDPLREFFRGLKSDEHTAKQANMFLAEDRVMCLEILRKYSKDYLLEYIPGAIGLTDPPTSIMTLIKQRRRWTNGSLFASWHVLDHLNLMTRSGHSCLRKFMMFFVYVYMTLNFIFSLLLVGSLFATYSILIRSFFPQDSQQKLGFYNLFLSGYVILLFCFTVCSLTKPIEKSGVVYRGIVIIFAIFMLVSVGFGLKYFYEEQLNSYLGYFIAGTMIATYVFPYLLNFDKIHIIKFPLGCFFLMLLSPLYINMFIIYAIANLHDISWGNRETDLRQQEKTQDNLLKFRVYTFIIWLSCNIIYGYGILYLQTYDNKGNSFASEVYLATLFILVSF